MEHGAWSREHGAWSREHGAGSMGQGAGSKEQGAGGKGQGGISIRIRALVPGWRREPVSPVRTPFA